MTANAFDFHWALIDSPLGVAGVVAGEGGCVRRVVLPCPTAEEARGRIGAALAALDSGAPSRGGRPEERLPESPEPLDSSALEAGENGPWTRESAQQIAEFLRGRRRAFDLPFDLGSIRGFTRDALLAAAQIPYGQTRSYWWVSLRAGNPRAMRAVGQAMARNPLPLLIPCHRVVRSDGSLGGFGGGSEQKRLLIQLESRIAVAATSCC